MNMFEMIVDCFIQNGKLGKLLPLSYHHTVGMEVRLHAEYTLASASYS
jgi:hypothetical protein